MKTINGIKLYDTKELALLLDVTTATIYGIRAKGLIKFTKIGTGYYYSEQAVRDYLLGKFPKGEERANLSGLGSHHKTNNETK